MTRFGATILDADGLRLSADEAAFFRDADPFGFILFARNIDTPDQVRALCADMRNAVGRDAIITIDQEGGRVQRMRAPHWRDWSPPLELGAQAGKAAARAMGLRFAIMAAELRDVGIDSNCAPLLDIARDDTHPFLRNRCYGHDADTVAQIGRAASDAMLAGGVLPVMKHIPGHGRGLSDSHVDLPIVSAGRDALRADFAPFAALRDLPMAMTAHLVYTALDDQPATVSPVLIDLIRTQIGFDGLLMTDDISMKALRDPPPVTAAKAIAAGCDMVLYCNASLADRVRVADAAGTLSDAAQTRAQRAMDARISPPNLDIAALDDQLEALLQGRGHV